VRLDDKRKNAYQFGRGEALPEANNVLPTREQLEALHSTFAPLHGNSDPQGSPSENGSVSIQNDAKVRAKFAQKSDTFADSENEKPHRNGKSGDSHTTLEGDLGRGSISVQKCKSPESEDPSDETFVQKSDTFARGHAKVEEGDAPKAEPPTRGRESLADWAKERTHYGRELYLCDHERKDEDEDLWECLDCLATSYDNEFPEDELRFWYTPIHKRITLREWVRTNLVPSEKLYNSYSLKHEAERALGFYVEAGELKGAMLEAGLLPTNRRGWDWEFKYAPLHLYRLELQALIWDLLMWKYLGLTPEHLRTLFLRREARARERIERA